MPLEQYFMHRLQPGHLVKATSFTASIAKRLLFVTLQHMLQSKEIETLFRTYYRPLCLYALHYLGDPEAVEDVVQESFTALWRQENGESVVN